MKLSKRAITIMMIIFCVCVMIVPMTAIASSSACPPHHVTKANQQNSVTTTKHEYVYGTIENEDGTEEYFYDDCTITITIDRYEKACKKCDFYWEQQGPGEMIHHGR